MHKLLLGQLVGLLALAILANNFAKVQAKECRRNEECKKIQICSPEEQERFMNDHLSFRFCGFFDPDEVCCKVVPKSPFEIKSSTTGEHLNVGLINSHNCGTSTSDRIRNGNIAALGAYPWMALLQYRQTDGSDKPLFMCGGSLISPKHVLSAAHCITDALFSVRLGENVISTDPDCRATCIREPIQNIEVERTVKHMDYKDNKSQKLNDIALIVLKEEANLEGTKYVRTICLPVKSDEFVENLENSNEELQVTIAGWGSTGDSNKAMSDDLLEVHIPYISNKACAALYDELMTIHVTISVTIEETNLCTYHATKDACNGDSGSPVVFFSEDRLYQQAVVSQGIGCREKRRAPGVHIRVSKYMNWILDNLS